MSAIYSENDGNVILLLILNISWQWITFWVESYWVLDTRYNNDPPHQLINSCKHSTKKKNQKITESNMVNINNCLILIQSQEATLTIFQTNVAYTCLIGNWSSCIKLNSLPFKDALYSCGRKRKADMATVFMRIGNNIQYQVPAKQHHQLLSDTNKVTQCHVNFSPRKLLNKVSFRYSLTKATLCSVLHLLSNQIG